MLTDTHTHLYLEEFAEDGGGAKAVVRAIEAGVGKMIFPNVGLNTIEPMKALAGKFPGIVSMAMGLHPTEVGEGWLPNVIAAMAELGDGKGYVAVGEVGIDLYWDKTYEREQMLAFEIQVEQAVGLGLPLIIHCREGQEQALEVLQGHKEARAVFHSFGGTVKDVERIRSVGDYYFGINGIVTFKNCKVREALEEITLDRLLLETDSPYLAPVPHRGKRNESAYLVHTAAHIAAHLGMPIEAVGESTSANASALFGI